MRYLFLLAAIVSGLTIQAQGLTREYNSECDCVIVKNHFDNGQLSTEFQETSKGKRIGTEKIYYANGALQMERNWSNGVLNGEGKHYHQNGQVYLEEYYTNGTKTGTWIFYEEDGTKFQDIQYTGNGNDGTYNYYSAGVCYYRQVVMNNAVSEEKVLNEEIYTAKLEEAEAAKDAKK